jgi:hypothetical protein
MSGATQILSLAAGYLVPELRARRARSFADLLQMLMSVMDLLRHASTSAVLAMTSDVVAGFESWRDYLARDFWLAAITLRPRGLRPVWREPHPSTPNGRRTAAGAARPAARFQSVPVDGTSRLSPSRPGAKSDEDETRQILASHCPIPQIFSSRKEPRDEDLLLRRRLGSTLPDSRYPCVVAG